MKMSFQGKFNGGIITTGYNASLLRRYPIKQKLADISLFDFNMNIKMFCFAFFRNDGRKIKLKKMKHDHRLTCSLFLK